MVDGKTKKKENWHCENGEKQNHGTGYGIFQPVKNKLNQN
jgi:hypothetical protein